MFRLIVIPIGISGVIVALAAANVRQNPAAIAVDWRVVRRPPLPVLAERPTSDMIVQTTTARGVVMPATHVQIGSQMVGRVIAVHVKDGDHVKKGDLLIKLDESDPRARLNSATAKIAR